jgi:hypothetical protein
VLLPPSRYTVALRFENLPGTTGLHVAHWSCWAFAHRRPKPSTFALQEPSPLIVPLRLARAESFGRVGSVTSDDDQPQHPAFIEYFGCGEATRIIAFTRSQDAEEALGGHLAKRSTLLERGIPSQPA